MTGPPPRFFVDAWDPAYGASFEASLDPVTGGPSWYRRPEVWGAGGVAGVLGAAAAWMLVRRRRRRSEAVEVAR